MDGGPRSNLRNIRRKLIFVPAGQRYESRNDYRVPPRITYFYLEPSWFPTWPETSGNPRIPAARLFFDDPELWKTIGKLNAAIEAPASDDTSYLEALGSVLVHELARMDVGAGEPKAIARGGLAAWQQRVAVEHIEAHLAETLQLAELAALVRLSPWHFCRAFKQSVGLPPLRYRCARRMERARQFLAQGDMPVTEIGLELGFSETSSFTAAFRRVVGLTPTAYRRSLACRPEHPTVSVPTARV